MFSTVSQWLLLGKVLAPVRVVGFALQLLVLAAVAVYALRRLPRESEGDNLRLIWLLGLFAGIYLLVLIFTASFVDADTVFDSRSLLPVHVAVIIVAIFLARAAYLNDKSGFIKPGLILFVMVMIISHSWRLREIVGRNWRDGQGYASRSWTNSASINVARNLELDIRIYSNGYDPINYLTNKRAILIPEKTNHGTSRPNSDYDQELRMMREEIIANRAALIYFSNLGERTYLPSATELEEGLSLPSETLSDGTVFYSQHRSPP
jgi:hypothetical protein